MNIDHMRAFLEVAATGNFNRAAERLHVTQSTVSARIKALEDQLGQALFLRGRAGAQLTPAGEQVHRYIELAVMAWQQARQEVALSGPLTRSFGLGIQFDLWERLAPDWIVWMQSQSPETAVRVEPYFSDNLNRALADGLLDMAVLYVPRSMPGFVVETLIEEDLVLYATEPREVDRGWIADYVFIDWGDEFRAGHGRAFPEMRTAAVSTGLSAVALRHILTRGGAAYLLEHAVADLVAEGRLHPVTGAPRFPRPAYLSYAAQSPKRALIEVALDGLRRAIGQTENSTR